MQSLNNYQLVGGRLSRIGNESVAKSLSPSGGHSDPTHGYREDLFELPAAALGICDGVAECRKAYDRYEEVHGDEAASPEP